MSHSQTVTGETNPVSVQSSRRAATIMDIGNVIAALSPSPLGVFWLAASAWVYARHKRHPNAKVRYYTRRAAGRLYGVVGVVIPIAVLSPGEGADRWLIAWGLAALIIIPWSLWSLARIRADRWDAVVPSV